MPRACRAWTGVVQHAVAGQVAVGLAATAVPLEAANVLCDLMLASRFARAPATTGCMQRFLRELRPSARIEGGLGSRYLSGGRGGAGGEDTWLATFLLTLVQAWVKLPATACSATPADG
jgi:hypothetical protein